MVVLKKNEEREGWVQLECRVRQSLCLYSMRLHFEMPEKQRVRARLFFGRRRRAFGQSGGR